MAGVIDSFFAKLGFQVDAQGVEQFQAKTASLRSSILAIGALTTVAAAGIGAMVMNVAQGMDDVGDFADIAGMAAREVAALGKIASMNDSSFEAMKSSIQGIANVTGQAALGIGRGAKTFEMLGFEAKDATGKTKGAYDMLGEIADRMKDMSAGEKLAMASKLGIDASLIPLLSKGSAAFRQLKEEAEAANPLTDEQYAQADRIVKLWNKATASAGVFTKVLAAKLFPVMERVLTYWNDLFKAGKKATNSWISAGLDVFVATLVTVWDWLGRIVDAGNAVFDWLTKFKIVVWAAGAALAVLLAYQAGLFFTMLGGAIATAVKALFAFNAVAILPVALIGGLVVAIALLVDELVNFYEGNDSVIGQLSKDYPYAVYIAQAALALVTAALVALKWQAMTTVASLLASGASLAAGWIASFASMAVATIAATWPLLLIIAAVAAVGYAIYKLWENWSEVTELLKSAWALFTGLLQTAAKSALDYVAGLFDAAKANVMAFIDGVTTAISKVGELFGLSGKNISLETAAQGGNAMGDNSYGQSPLEAAIAGANGLPQSMPSSGVLGRAAQGSNSTASTTTTDTTNITGTVINVASTDPAKAGESVREALQNQIKRSTRNGQSAKQL
jgi:hypothetical protein